VAEYVTASVQAVDGNVRAAARKLGISPSTIYAKMRRSP
jgi:transcriptional regulator of acetoin/glycerol metabolism